MQVIDEETRRFGRLLHYAGVLSAVLCATAAYSLLYTPTLQAVEDRSARIEGLRLSLRNAPIAREQHRKVSEKLREVTRRIAEVQGRVPEEANAGEFLKEVTQLASSEQLGIKDFSPEKPLAKSGYSEMEVTLKGTGSFASICSFVDRLAKLKRLSKVKNLTLSTGDGKNEYPLTATLVIYFGLKANQPNTGQGDRRG